MRILVTGWFSFLHGEATAGDLLALEAVLPVLPEPYDVAWSPVLRPGGPSLDDCPPERYTDLVFVCGPLHGPLISELHERYSLCRRIANQEAFRLTTLDEYLDAYSTHQVAEPNTSVPVCGAITTRLLPLSAIQRSVPRNAPNWGPSNPSALVSF